MNEIEHLQEEVRQLKEEIDIKDRVIAKWKEMFTRAMESATSSAELAKDTIQKMEAQNEVIQRAIDIIKSQGIKTSDTEAMFTMYG